YAGLFGNDPEKQWLRESYAIPPMSVKTDERMHLMNGFFFWASWACGTDRPDSSVTYTNNWPHEDLIDNQPSGAILLWSIASMILLLAGVGLLAWYMAIERHKNEAPHEAPAENPLLKLGITPSMRATLKYFWVVAALMLAQLAMG